jgi:hypothetical protein
MMEKKIKLMSDLFKNRGHHVNSCKDAKTSLVASELLKRLSKGYEERTEFHIKDSLKEHKLEKYYLEYFCKLLNKNLLKWWD